MIGLRLGKAGGARSGRADHADDRLMAATAVRDQLRPLVFTDLVQLSDVDRLTGSLTGVRRTTVDGQAQWRYHGRLVARQLDRSQLVIRADFDYRDVLLQQFPATFSVPPRYRKHMMVVADLAAGDPDAIEDALEAAWQLQRSAG